MKMAVIISNFTHLAVLAVSSHIPRKIDTTQYDACAEIKAGAVRLNVGEA